MKTMLEIIVGIVTLFSMIYDFFTYPIYFFLQRPWRTMRLHRQKRSEDIQRNDSSVTIKSIRPKSAIHMQLAEAEINTLGQMIRYGVRLRGNTPFLGTRDILAEEDEVQPNKKVFRKFVMGDYQWRSYSDVDRESDNIGRGLRELGMNARDRVVIFAETRAEWLLSAFGCFKQNIILVTLYATLGDDALAHAINETEVTCIITSHDLLPKLKPVLDHTKHVKYVVYMEDQIHKTDAHFTQDVKVIAYKDLIKVGEESDKEGEEGEAHEVAVIMYTSGSTGSPKGVLLTHSNILSAQLCFTDVVAIDDMEIYLAYLPLAHIMEFLCETMCYTLGCRIGYSSALTLMDNSSKIKIGSKGDTSVLQPTAMASVPLILDRVYKGIQDKVAKGGKISETLFQFAVKYKIRWYKKGFNTPLLNKFLFGRVRKILGGKIWMIFSGGAPLSADIQEYLRACLCVDVNIGYGLTETTGCAMLQDQHDRSNGRVGAPHSLVHISLENWEEGNYKVTDRPYPRGEILIGGPCIAQGYYKLEEKTSEDFYDDKEGRRWLRSGDIGELQNDGIIKIIDRKKDLVKLQFGEYVALGKVESELKTHALVDNICVYGDPQRTFTVALVVPDRNQLKMFASKIGRNGVTFETMCADLKLHVDVCKELQQHGTKCKLEKFEIPGVISLCQELWLPESGLVTAALKLRRKNIQDYYQREIDAMYSS